MSGATIVYAPQFKDQIYSVLKPDGPGMTIDDLMKIYPDHHRTDFTEATRALKRFNMARFTVEQLNPNGYRYRWWRV